MLIDVPPRSTDTVFLKQLLLLQYTLDDMASDAVSLLEALGIEKAHIVGASMGGMIAQRIAYNYPERTLSLASIMAGGGSNTFPLVAKPDVMSSIPPPGAPGDTTAYIAREVQSRTILAGTTHPPDKEKLQKQIRAEVNRSYYPAGFFRQGAVSMAGFFAGRRYELQTIEVPTVVIHGNEDPLVALEAAKDVAANIPNANFILIEGMGHNLPDPLLEKLAGLIVENAEKNRK